MSDIYCDLTAEEQLLSYLAFTDYSQLIEIDANIFYGKDHRIIFEGLKKIQSNIPKKLFRDTLSLKVGTTKFDEISASVESVEKAVNPKTDKIFQSIKKYLQDLWIQREIISGCKAAQNNAEKGYIDDALLAVRSILQTQVKQKVETGDYVGDAAARMALKRSMADKTGREITLIPTGILQYDKISGGIQRGEVGVVVAETGGGKSLALANFGLYAYLQGFNVHFFGLEMKRFENQFRVDSALTSIPANLFRFSKLTEADYKIWQSEIKKLQKERKNYFEFSSARGIGVTDLLSFVESTENKYGKSCDLLLLDYLTLLEDESKQKDFHVQQRNTFITLSDWAMTRQKAVWTASQSTDEGIKRKDGARTVDVKYSRAISEFAQIILVLHAGKEDAISGKLNLIPRKGRGFKKDEKIVLKPDFAHNIIDQRSFLLNRGKEISEVKSKNVLGKK